MNACVLTRSDRSANGSVTGGLAGVRHGRPSVCAYGWISLPTTVRFHPTRGLVTLRVTSLDFLLESRIRAGSTIAGVVPRNCCSPVVVLLFDRPVPAD